MPTTSYYTVGGRIIGQRASGSNRKDFLADALGSVTAETDQAGTVVGRTRYKPYGAELQRTGASQPAFRWVGSVGYRVTPANNSDVYVRARHYAGLRGQWTSQDPIRTWDTSRYGYVFGNPTTHTDPSGEIPLVGGPGCDKCANICGYKNGVIPDLNRAIATFCNGYLNSPTIRAKIDKCSNGAFSVKCIETFCNQSGTVIPCYTNQVGEKCKATVERLCPAGYECTEKTARVPNYAETLCAKAGDPLKNKIHICCWDLNTVLTQCCCRKDAFYSEQNCKDAKGNSMAILLHELVHACSKKDCAPHPKIRPFPHDVFAECVNRAFTPPLYL